MQSKTNIKPFIPKATNKDMYDYGFLQIISLL